MAEKKPTAEIADLLQEDRTFPPPDAFRAQALVCDDSVYARADRDPEGFWATFASELRAVHAVDQCARLAASPRQVVLLAPSRGPKT